MRWNQDALAMIRQQAAREALRTLGLLSLEDVWRELGKDQDQGIDRVSSAAGIDRSDLVRDLVDSSILEAEAQSSSWLRRHAPDFSLVIAVAVLVILVIWAVPRSRSAGIALRDLRAGDPVSTVVLHGADPARLAGRELSRGVAAGSYVDPAWLTPVPGLGKQRLQGRYRMTLRIRPEDFRLLPPLPALGSLAVAASGETTPRALLLTGVPILAAERSGERVNLDAAFSEVELRALMPLLPHADIRVLRRIP